MHFDLTPPLPSPNAHERDFAALAHAQGWVATHRGWPDFLCLTTAGELMAVEVKQSPRSRLKAEQVLVMEALAAYGIPCYVSDGKTIVPFDVAVHGRPASAAGIVAIKMLKARSAEAKKQRLRQEWERSRFVPVVPLQP